MIDQKQKRGTSYMGIDLIPLIAIFLTTLYFYKDFYFSKSDLFWVMRGKLRGFCGKK